MQNGERVPQWLIIGTPISQYTSYSVMFCLLHGIQAKNAIKSIPAIHQAIMENMEDSLMMCTPIST